VGAPAENGRVRFAAFEGEGVDGFADLQHPAVRRFVLPTLRADFACLEAYRGPPADAPPLACPLVATGAQYAALKRPHRGTDHPGLLRRLVALSAGIAGVAEADDTRLAPVETLDGFGTLGPPQAAAGPIAARDFAATAASPPRGGG
jgi:hypothetical protein